MQQRVLLGAGALAVAAVAFVALRGAGRHEAGKVADQAIPQLLASLPPGYAVKHGAIDYNPLTGSATIHDLQITRDPGVSWTADTVTIATADQAALRDVFDPAAYPGGKPAWSDRRLLIADAGAHGIHATIAGDHPMDYTIRDVSLHRLTGRPFALPPTPENRAKPAFAADAALAFAADSFVEDDTKLDDPSDNKSKLTIASVEAHGYDGGKLTSFLARDLTLDAKDKKDSPVHMSLASISLKDADSSAVLRSVQQTGKADNAAMARSSYGSVDVGALDFSAAGAIALQWHDIHAEQGAADSNGVREGRASLHAMTIGLSGAAVPAKVDAALDAFGMRNLTLDIDGAARGKPGAGTQITETIALKDLGTLHVKAAFSGYAAPAGADTAAAMGALMATTLEGATLVWDDASLTDRIFKVAAAQANTTPELIRGQLAMPILAAGVMVPDQPDVADQLTAFLNHPHTLTITLNPPQKISLGEVATRPATERAHALGLHVAGN